MVHKSGNGCYKLLSRVIFSNNKFLIPCLLYSLSVEASASIPGTLWPQIYFLFSLSLFLFPPDFPFQLSPREIFFNRFIKLSQSKYYPWWLFLVLLTLVFILYQDSPFMLSSLHISIPWRRLSISILIYINLLNSMIRT